MLKENKKPKIIKQKFFLLKFLKSLVGKGECLLHKPEDPLLESSGSHNICSHMYLLPSDEGTGDTGGPLGLAHLQPGSRFSDRPWWR